MKLRNWVAALLLVTLSPVAAQEAESSASPRPAQEASAETVTSLSDLAITVEDILPQTIPTEHFAARSAYRSFELSPDGQTLASMVVSEGNRRLALIDAETGEVTRVYNVGESERVDWYRWAGNEKLIMSISMLTVSYGIPIRVSRLAVRNVITNDVWLLDAPRSVLWGGDLVHVDEEGQYALVSMQRSRRSDPSVYRYALEPGAERERIVRPKGGVQAWYADDAGVVRMGIGYRNRRLRIYYRDDANGSFELIDKLRAGDDKARY